MSGPAPWSEPVRLNQIGQTKLTRRIVADEAARKEIARDLGLDRLDQLQAELTIEPWFDGVQVRGRWSASIEQTCGVTLEPLPSELQGEFTVRAVPAGSPHAPQAAVEEVVVDPDSEDPPDVLDEDAIDLAAFVVEQLALEVDPFPRKPGAEFVQPDMPQPPSPFEALRNFKPGPTKG
jgi:hypothetical protein